ncbi:hypothetical protein [Paenibacillus rhizophilus]|uniref:hypothetical protein n=1 Tax=Paenibacillus rhizophilus TaxID=1850366 RepID=UPI00163967BF|nr:hypothetical protein [Paenibacillus rhizophilus]
MKFTSGELHAIETGLLLRIKDLEKRIKQHSQIGDMEQAAEEELLLKEAKAALKKVEIK